LSIFVPNKNETMRYTILGILLIVGVLAGMLYLFEQLGESYEKVENEAAPYVGRQIVIGRDTTTVIGYSDWKGGLVMKDGTVVRLRDIKKFKMLEDVEVTE